MTAVDHVVHVLMIIQLKRGFRWILSLYFEEKHKVLHPFVFCNQPMVKSKQAVDGYTFLRVFTYATLLQETRKASYPTYEVP